MITPQEHIEQKLVVLLQGDTPLQDFDEDIEEKIYKIILNKKYRKYSANEKLQKHIKNAITINIKGNAPINITFLHGAYKLWRLEESPEVDWAELFALTYYTNWLKNICAIYPPGVHFDSFADDYILPHLHTDSLENSEKYVASYQKLLEFLKPHQPSNFTMTITPVRTFFISQKEFDRKLLGAIKKDLEQSDGHYPQIDQQKIKSIEFNARVSDAQKKDPLWQQKISHTESAYSPLKKESNYYDSREDKILAFTQPLPSGKTISVGTTRRAIMKFWVGAGVLVKKDDHFVEDILSPMRLEETSATWHDINIKNLDDKNFSRIRTVEEYR